MSGALHLVGSRLHESRTDARGSIIEANFYVEATGRAAGVAIYLLPTMTESAYNLWYFERSNDPEAGIPLEEDTFPLVVPDSALETRGLVEHIQAAYLNLEAPERINSVAQFLLCVYSDDPEA